MEDEENTADNLDLRDRRTGSDFRTEAVAREPRDEQLHERLRTLLSTADGETCRIIATFIDIRGFSGFANTGESFDTAAYLRSVFTTILSRFEDATYFKPTGDGLLLVHHLPTDLTALRTVVNSTLQRSLHLVAEFGELTRNDPLINFPVPQQVGVGIARGSATRLISEGLVLDYAGRCLNLASRLTDKARPSGVVFADDRADQLMEPELATQFATDRVIIRSIAEQEPMAVYISDGVQIGPIDREPIPHSGRTWGAPVPLSVQEVRDLLDYGFYLARPPHTYERVAVHVTHPSYDDHGRDTGSVSSLTIEGQIELHPDGVCVRIPFEQVKMSLARLPTTGTLLGFSYKLKVTFTPFSETVLAID